MFSENKNIQWIFTLLISFPILPEFLNFLVHWLVGTFQMEHAETTQILLPFTPLSLTTLPTLSPIHPTSYPPICLLPPTHPYHLDPAPSQHLLAPCHQWLAGYTCALTIVCSANELTMQTGQTKTIEFNTALVWWCWSGSKYSYCTQLYARKEWKWWYMHPDFKTHGYSHPKSEIEDTSKL